MGLMVVFGGAFSPVTNAHLSLAEQIANERPVDKLLFLPVSDLYQKRDLLSARHRVEMLRRVFRSNPKFEVSEVETNAPALLNTIDSLRLLQSQYPNQEIAFVMGSDNLRQLPGWSGFSDLIREFRMMVITRGGDDVMRIIEEIPDLRQHANRFIPLTEAIRNDGNSTYVRKLLRAGKSIRYLVPDEVFYYIQEHQLFMEGVAAS